MLPRVSGGNTGGGPFIMSLDCSKRDVVEDLYRKMLKAAAAKAYSVVQRRDVAMEIAQEAFVTLWKKQPRFPNERAAYAYIYRCCHNKSIDHLRAKQTTDERATDDLSYFADERLSFASRIIDRQELAQWLRRLSEQEAQLLAYTVLDGMNQEEIAEVMDLSLRSVQRYLQKLRAKIDSWSTEAKTPLPMGGTP